MKRPVLLNGLVLTALSAALFVACSDSGDSTGADDKEVVELKNGKTLRCDESYEGAVAAIADGDFRRCEDGAWVKIDSSEAMKAEEILGIVKDSDKDDDSDEKSSSSKGGDKPKPESSCSEASSANSSSSTGKDDSKYDPKANTLKDLRDGQIYKTVEIGKQVWMAENLKYDYNEGSANSYVNEKYPESGRYYTWAAAMDSAGVFSDKAKGCGYDSFCSSSESVRGVCPIGWHLPNFDEWEELWNAVGGEEVAGKMLKTKTGWNKNGDDDGNGMDAYGFSALPAGYNFKIDFEDENIYFEGEGEGAFFWSTSENSRYNAYGVRLSYISENADLVGFSKNFARHVRCLQD